MRFPLTDQLRDEAERFALRWACRHCFFFVAGEDRCAHEWPNQAQRRWPLPEEAGGEVDFCKEFELD